MNEHTCGLEPGGVGYEASPVNCVACQKLGVGGVGPGALSAEPDHYVTKSGKVLTHDDIEKLAAEAERGYEDRIHKAAPSVAGSYACGVCGQRIGEVPGGQGPVWVHADSGAVAAPNPSRLTELAWAPYAEFGIPDALMERTEAPDVPVHVRAVGYQHTSRGAEKIVIYWTHA